ncbi:hypothetical protein ACFTZK_11405 [Streptomyces decoyicus]
MTALTVLALSGSLRRHQDLDAGTPPESVTALRRRAADADALLIKAHAAQ